MAPTLTALQNRIHFVAYDISGLLKRGKNVIAIWYKPGWTTFGSYGEGLRAAIKCMAQSARPGKSRVMKALY